jgi:hypothetical protein
MAERRVWRKRKGAEKMTPAVARDLGIMPAVKKTQGKPLPEMQQLSPEKIRKTREAVQRIAERYKTTAELPKTQEETLPEKAPVVTYPLSAVADEIPTCPRPDCKAPGSPVKIDKLGRAMGFCAACLVARGRQGGIESHKNGRTAAPYYIPLNLEKWAELRQWLQAQADENERTLQAEIMFRLKLVMRAGGE